MSLEQEPESPAVTNWMDHRLLLRPHLRFSAGVHVHMDIDVMDALRFGSNPEVLPALGALQESGEAFDEPVLLVCDRENRRLQTFALDGTFIDVVATDLRRPCAVAFHGDHVAIAELEGRVTILDQDFNLVGHVGDNPDRGQWAKNGVPVDAWQDGVFTAPHGVCFDADGNLYVMDWNAHGRMSKLLRK